MDTAPLDKHRVEFELDTMRRKLAKEFGVTVVTDYNGAWGKAGTTHLTLRFKGEHGDSMTASFELTSLSSREEDKAQEDYENEDK